MLLKKMIYIMVCLAVIILAGCSKSEESKQDTIRKVLDQEFTAPDKEYIEIWKDPENQKVVNEKYENKKLNQYLEKNYGPYYTDAGLQSFIAAYGGTQYHLYADNSGHKLSLKDVTFEQNESDSNLYTFVASVGYMKEGAKEKTANVEGEVTFSKEEEGKIEAFQYGNDDGLSDELRK